MAPYGLRDALEPPIKPLKHEKTNKHNNEKQKKTFFGILGPNVSVLGPIGQCLVVFGAIVWTICCTLVGPFWEPFWDQIGPRRGPRMAQEGHQELQKPPKLHLQKPYRKL